MNLVKLNGLDREKLLCKELEKKNIEAEVLRLDKIHPVISGNKWFKLKPYLEELKKNNHTSVLTFGGAYSNHILATACTCQALGLKSIGIIRGERASNLSHTLADAESYGMQLICVTREQYKKKKELLDEWKDSLIIPEGGAGPLGVRGASVIMDLLPRQNYTHFLCAVGTGTTLAGLASVTVPGQHCIGISVLKGMEDKDPNNETARKFTIIQDYHFGGYAKKNKDLLAFMNRFYEETGIPSDFVYTGKLFYATLDLVKKDLFPPGSKLLLVHSGGLQGNLSLPKGALNY